MTGRCCNLTYLKQSESNSYQKPNLTCVFLADNVHLIFFINYTFNAYIFRAVKYFHIFHFLTHDMIIVMMKQHNVFNAINMI